MMNKISIPSRIIVAVAALSLIATYFLPVWFIYLLAPQYPEGLTMNIWLDKITGQVDIINGLNHYIGMKHIKAEMFPEFGYLIYIAGFYIVCGLLVAITGKRKLLFSYLVLIILGGIAAMYDFYSWGYDYGHNLDPTAAIQIPGFSYQPPLLGHKKLLNFDAYSYPDSGGWLIISVSLVLFLVWFIEWKRSRKVLSVPVINKKILSAAAAVILFSFNSCTTDPRPFEYGKDICDDCKMAIMDPKFGGQIITKKGRVYKFDDVHCLVNYLKNGTIEKADVARTVVIDYESKNDFLDAGSSFFVVSPRLKSPMNSHAACFINKQEAEKKAKDINGTVKTWDELIRAM